MPRGAVRGLTFLFIVAAAAAAALLAAELVLRPVILAMATAQVNTATVAAVNAALGQTLTGTVSYQQLMDVHYNAAGLPVLIQPDTVEINALDARAAVAVVAAVREVEAEHFSIPVGQVLGIQLLAALGPRIGVTVWPVGQVSVTLRDRFTSAGINQVEHTIYVHTEVHMRVAVPLLSTDIPVEVDNPLVSVYLMGPVPSSWVCLLCNGR